VNENVFETGDSLPFDIDQFANIVRKLLGCLAEAFQVPNHPSIVF